MTDTSAAGIDPAVVRDGVLNELFNAAASIGKMFGVSGRALYESLAPLAEDVALACIAAAGDAGAAVQGDGKGVDE